ncbi:MAG: GH32 C-terminal domain-containing protein [Chthonomonadales bacterium]|nr:GH32 C-terminal domain-containing protein [Chthonomonadales bacterium]
MRAAMTTSRRLATAALAALALLGAAAAEAGPRKDRMRNLTDKTLVAWVALAGLDQRGGSAITLDSGAGPFDGIVYAEIEPRRWMPGSEFWKRTPREQAALRAETSAPGQIVQMAAVYRGREVTLYRNGEEYARHEVQEPLEVGEGSAVVLGLRHLQAGDRACLAGEIEDARVYRGALTPAELGKLAPNRPGGPRPLAWFSFEGGSAADRAGTFAAGRLHGAAAIRGGRLVLPGGIAYMVAGAEVSAKRDPARWPAYHLTAPPEEGVCAPFDPNGCIWWKGRYHLMYIYQDPARANGGHTWGHLSSPDLVHWTRHPPALAPEPGDADEGTFSGNAFIDKDGVPMLCWFGLEAGVCVATAEDDDLIRWRKHPANPIIPIPKPGDPMHGRYTVWDPYLWLDDGVYRCLLGGNRLPNGKDTLYLCRSNDLVHWEPVGPFYEHADPGWTGEDEDCSCPDFFRLGDRWALLCISHRVGARVYVGRREGERFLPERHVRMNWPGGMFFAPESLRAADGRRIFWAWVTDPRVRPAQNATGSGTMSLPRELSLAPDGTPRIAPARETEALRRRRHAANPVDLPDGEDVTLRGIRGDCLEIAVEIAVGTAREVGLKVRCAPDGSEETAIWYDAERGVLRMDMSHSSLSDEVTYGQPPFASYGFQRAADNPKPYTRFEAPLALAPGEPLRLRVYLDRPMVEAFANDRQCVTQQVFPSRRDSVLVRAGARGGVAHVRSAEAWEMAPIVYRKDAGR